MALTTKLIFNLTQERCVCVSEVADGPLSRARGLLGRSGLPAGEGLLLSPSPSIHTAFMRFPIDAVFLDRDLTVLGIVERLRPWRIASRRRARAVLELAAGECARRGIQVGDRLGLRERRPVVERSPGLAGNEHAASHARARRGAPPVGGTSVIWPGSLETEAPATGQSSMRVLVISRDRHFRSVTSMLLANRGCSVRATGKADGVAEIITRDGADVVVVDADNSPATAQAVAAVGALARPVGVVIVDEAPGTPRPPLVLPKWGPFEDLLAAIEQAGHQVEDDRA